MSKEYGHIKKHEKEIMELRSQGYSRRYIGEKLGLTVGQIKDFIKRYNRKQRLIIEGKPVKHRGKPSKYEGELPTYLQKSDKISQMKYVMAIKDKYIKQLEMEIELMRDFLSLTERK